ncbi:SubName: Full=Uncharacterized protein {ECO:0000313/EMBL:CCA74605.1} [Serendipita indica DSM 11827]|uniref:Eukaryotic translation initiation factor 3 30 kDa subunit n=1 Tax=Serendipita indica (strain DSM 11827) TaxID=1109443 RepID=G4TTG2_SERID|nr:SubName: Full=Uncharacterized protein {ECO:0000313/EMBL:CCA74605.1} [Serendipita indica DSM 11827]CCA74605.1 hypothetical protein PIIN_08557 [Serendipita indica DSM 11827]
MSDWDGSGDESRETKNRQGGIGSGSNVDPTGGSDVEEASSSTKASNAKKKASLKQKLAEKEAAQKRRLESGQEEKEYMDLREKFMDEKEMRRVMREKELEADLRNASDLFGDASLDDKKATLTTRDTSNTATSSTKTTPEIPAHLKPFLTLPAKIQTKADFEALSKAIYTHLIKPHTSSPQYGAFVEMHARTLCGTLRETETRKVANVVAGVATEKAAEARKAANATKKKAQATAASSKAKYDLNTYDDDDFGNNPDDFM